MGKFITEVGEKLAEHPRGRAPRHGHLPDHDRRHGERSSEWSLEGVKTLIEQQREQWNWEFIFMGANMDAVEVAASMGISPWLLDHLRRRRRRRP